MNQRSDADRSALAPSLVGCLAGLLLPGCSIFYDLSANQCDSNAQCSTGFTCQAGVCLSPTGNAGTGGESSGGSGGQGGDNTAGTSGACQASCCSNQECIQANSGLPYACIDGECVDARGPQCLVLDDTTYSRLASDNPIILGALTVIPDLNPSHHQITKSYQLALDMFHTATGGVPAASGSRKVVVVACDALDTSNLNDSLEHLTETLGVPGVITPLLAGDLQAAFQTHGQPNQVFFLSPFEADQELARLEDNGLLWHMLGSTDALAQVYRPLLDRAEARVLSSFDPAPAAEEIRVAWVQNDQRFMQQLSADIRNEVAAAKDPNFILRNITSDFSGNANADAIQAIVEFRPHIVFAMAGSEFVADLPGGFMRGLEENWTSIADSQPPPFYLLSPWHAGNPDLSNYIVNNNASVADRLAGINHATAVDAGNLNSYLTSFRGVWTEPGAEGYENFYDSMWYMLLAVAAAGNVPTTTGLTGPRIADGMWLLTNRDGQRYDLLESQISPILNALESTVDGIALYGTMGEPNFNRGRGVRLTPGSVYCVEPNGDFSHDVLRYDEGTSLLTGDFTCIEGF